MEENISKALIMTAEVLIGILLLTIMVYAFSAGRNFSETVNDNIAQKVVTEFNAKFEYYNLREDLTAQDVVTLANLIHSYNTDENTGYPLNLEIKGISKEEMKYLQNGPSKQQAIEFMQKYAPYIQNNGQVAKRNFRCELEYGDNGRITKIKIQKIS